MNRIKTSLLHLSVLYFHNFQPQQMVGSGRPVAQKSPPVSVAKPVAPLPPASSRGE